MEQNINTTEPRFSEETSGFDYKRWLKLIVSQWYLFVLGAAIAFGVAWIKNRSWLPQYHSSALVMIKNNQNTSGGGSANVAFMRGFGVQEAYSNLENYKIMIHSSNFIGRVLDSLPKLEVDYFTKGQFRTRNVYKSSPIYVEHTFIAPEAYNVLFKLVLHKKGTYTITVEDNEAMKNFREEGALGIPLSCNMFAITIQSDKYVEDIPIYFCFRSRDWLIGNFSSRLGMSPVSEKSTVMSISLVGDNYERDIDFLNTLCQVILEQNLEQKNYEANRTISFLNEKLVDFKQSLSETEKELSQFKNQNEMGDIRMYSTEIYSDMASTRKEKLNLELRGRYLNYLEDYLVKNMSEDSIMSPGTMGWNDAMLMEAVQQMNKLFMQRNNVPQGTPLYEQNTRDIEAAKRAARESIKMMRFSLQVEQDEITRKERETKKEMLGLATKELEIKNLERKYTLNDKFNDFFSTRKMEAEIQKTSNKPDHEIFETAKLNYITNAQETKKTTTQYMAIGLLIPLLIVILRNLFNDTVRSVEELEKITSYPNIGAVRHTNVINPVATAKYPRSSFAEMFRVIKTRIEFIVQRKTGIVVLITSTESGDGKTYFSTNLTATYGMTKHKTLLVDMDIRKPSVLKAFGVDKCKGVTDYLIGDCELQDIIMKINDIDYDMISGGTIPPNPGELVQSDKLHQMFETLRKDYEYIVVDTSPVGLVADAYTLMNHVADINLFVVREAKTNKIFVKKLANQLKTDKIKHLYTVFNDVAGNGKQKGIRKYIGAYNYSSYAYGGYGYGNYFSTKKKTAVLNRKKYYEDEEGV